jgi:hypothetical protein
LLSGLYTFAAAGLILVVVLLVLSWGRFSIGRFPARFPLLFRHRFARFFAKWLERFASAMDVLYSPTRPTITVLLTCLG